MSAPPPLVVALGERSYPIHIGAGLLDDPAVFAPYVASRDAAIVTNATVAPLLAARLETTLAACGANVRRIVLPDGEAHKTWETLNLIYDALLASHADRKSILVALGGGVVGDLTGFAAATYQRGVAYLQVPTTLLAQVDSSVGGKTAINHPLGKNMIGAFHQPIAVIADVETLATLPKREVAGGLAEVVKYGAVRDIDFLGWLEAAAQGIERREPASLARLIRRSCEIKAEVVAEDERESGVRAILNFGHTFGHAIEAATGYGTWLHGEAVAAGMVLAARLSADLGLLEPAAADRLAAILATFHLPIAPPRIAVERWMEFMERDKKTVAGRITLILLERLGAARIEKEVSGAMLRRFLAAL